MPIAAFLSVDGRLGLCGQPVRSQIMHPSGEIVCVRSCGRPWIATAAAAIVANVRWPLREDERKKPFQEKGLTVLPSGQCELGLGKHPGDD